MNNAGPLYLNKSRYSLSLFDLAIIVILTASLNAAVELLALLIRVRQVPASNPKPEVGYTSPTT
jgi:hypothetical protein